MLTNNFRLLFPMVSMHPIRQNARAQNWKKEWLAVF